MHDNNCGYKATVVITSEVMSNIMCGVNMAQTKDITLLFVYEKPPYNISHFSSFGNCFRIIHLLAFESSLQKVQVDNGRDFPKTKSILSFKICAASQ